MSDDMGCTGFQHYVIRVLEDLLEDYFAALGRAVLVGGSQFFYYERGDPRAVLAPDVYVVDDCATHQSQVRSWKVWEHDGKVPTLALEVVSDEYGKDYGDRMIERYAQLGVREVIRYDPGHVLRGARRLFSHFVRDERGRLALQHSPRDRVRSVAFDLWFVQHSDLSLRIGLGPMGSALWPTQAERAVMLAERAAAEAERAAAEAERANVEAERAAAEAERANVEAERAAAEAARVEEERARAEEERARAAAEAARAEAAEAELQRLRAELARLRG